MIVSSAGRFLPSTLCHGLERVCCLRHCVTGIRFRNKNMSAHCVNCIRRWPQRNPGCPLCRVCPFCLPLWLNAGWRCHQCRVEPLLLQTQRCVLGKRFFVFRPMVLDLINVPLVVLIGLLSDLNNQTLLLIRTFAILQYLAQNVGPLVPLLCIDYTQLCELLKSTTSGPRPSWP